MLRTGKIFYNHIEIVCVTCPNILKMGIRTGATKSLGRTLNPLAIYIDNFINSCACYIYVLLINYLHVIVEMKKKMIQYVHF